MLRGWLPGFVALLLPAIGATDDGARRFNELGVGRGLDARVAVAMLVDREGLLWVGSREGLLRYDGYQASVFLPDPGRPGQISDIDIRALYEAEATARCGSRPTPGASTAGTRAPVPSRSSTMTRPMAAH